LVSVKRGINQVGVEPNSQMNGSRSQQKKLLSI
jgi:hypothetical protein